MALNPGAKLASLAATLLKERKQLRGKGEWLARSEETLIQVAELSTLSSSALWTLHLILSLLQLCFLHQKQHSRGCRVHSEPCYMLWDGFLSRTSAVSAAQTIAQRAHEHKGLLKEPI